MAGANALPAKVERIKTCPTDVKSLHKSVLVAIDAVRTAANAVENSSADKLCRPCADWELARYDLQELITQYVPRKIREALRTGKDELQSAWLARFRSSDPDKYCLYVPSLDTADDEIDKHDPHKHRLLVCDNLAQYLSTDHWALEWPDFEAAVRKTNRVFNQLLNKKVPEIIITVDYVKNLLIKLLATETRGWRRKADRARGANRRLMLAYADCWPSFGIPCDQLGRRVQEIDPAVDSAAIRVAADELERDGRIQKKEQTFDLFRNGDYQSNDTECWILTKQERNKQRTSRARRPRRRWLKPITENQHDAFLLHSKFLSYQQIADQLGMSKSAAFKHVQIAKEKLNETQRGRSVKARQSLPQDRSR